MCEKHQGKCFVLTALHRLPSHSYSVFQALIFFSMTVFTALFTNMRILKLKSQLTIAFFVVVNHVNGPLRKQNFTLTGSKGHGL